MFIKKIAAFVIHESQSHLFELLQKIIFQVFARYYIYLDKVRSDFIDLNREIRFLQ